MQLPDRDGRGVLVPGRFVLTAAHCIVWSPDARMELGNDQLQTVVTRTGIRTRLDISAIEPRADIAALDVFQQEDSAEFDRWAVQATPVRVRLAPPDVGIELPVHIYTHRDRWVAARVLRHAAAPSAMMQIVADRPIESGTSGSPVVDDDGLLVGVVSSSGDTRGTTKAGMIPSASFALPAWVWAAIVADQR